MEKNSYESRYELIDDKSLSWDISRKSTENRTHATKGTRAAIIVIIRLRPLKLSRIKNPLEARTMPALI